jgi:hypothetical protein
MGQLCFYAHSELLKFAGLTTSVIFAGRWEFGNQPVITNTCKPVGI